MLGLHVGDVCLQRINNGQAVLHSGTMRHLVPHDVYKVSTLSWEQIEARRWPWLRCTPSVGMFHPKSLITHSCAGRWVMIHPVIISEKITSACICVRNTCFAGNGKRNEKLPNYQTSKRKKKEGNCLSLDCVCKLNPCSVYTVIYSLQFTTERKRGKVGSDQMVFDRAVFIGLIFLA